MKLDMSVDSSKAVRGIDHVSMALADVVDDLEKVEKESGDTERDLVQDFKRIAQEAEKAGDRAGKGMSDGIRRGARDTRGAGGGFSEFKDEALQSGRETAASFGGGFQDVTGLIQEISANAFRGFGPAGFAAGLAAAAGIGLISAAFESAGEDAEKARQRVNDLVGELYQSHGDVGAIDTFEKLKTLLEEPPQGLDFFENIQNEIDKAFGGGLKDRYQQLIGYSEDYGLSVEDMMQAFSGSDSRTALRVISDLTEQQRKLNKQREDATSVSTANSLRQEADGIGEVIAQIQTENDLLPEAVERYDQITAAIGAANDARKLEQSTIAAVDDAYDDAAGATEGFIDAETGIFDTAAYITAMQERETALDNYQKNLETSGLSDEAKTFLNAQGAETAAAFLQGFTNATPEVQAELNRIWTEAGTENSGEYTGAFQTGLDGSTLTAPVTVTKPDVPLVLRDIQNEINKAGALKVLFKPQTPYAKPD